MEQLLHDIGGILAVRDVWDVFIYVMFFMTILMLILIPDKNMQPTTLMTIVLLLVVVDKVRPHSPGGAFLIEGFDNGGFGTEIIHMGMAILPYIAGALVRGRTQKERRAMPLGILTGIIGSVYAIAFFMANVPQ